jgi:hypothetical protein
MSKRKRILYCDKLSKKANQIHRNLGQNIDAEALRQIQEEIRRGKLQESDVQTLLEAF